MKTVAPGLAQRFTTATAIRIGNGAACVEIRGHVVAFVTASASLRLWMLSYPLPDFTEVSLELDAP